MQKAHDIDPAAV